MPETTSNSIVNLGDISKPADTLIKKVSKAVGGIFAPYQLKRMAKAEAEVAILKAETDNHIKEIHRRAMHRFIDEEAKRQENIESITGKTLPLLNENAKPDEVEDDWITNFFDKARIVSDSQMQQLWSRVLAGEANAPGTYSKRTVNFLSDLDKTDAAFFGNLCGFAWGIGGAFPLIFDTEKEFYRENQINFQTLSHLESIGLIKFNQLEGFIRIGLPKRFHAAYYGMRLQLEMPGEANNRLEVGSVLLTKVGQELARVCSSKPVPGFFEFVRERWKRFLPTAETTSSDAPAGVSTVENTNA